MQASLVKKAKNILTQDFSFEGDLIFSTDSRKIAKENAFICLYGENFDAFDLIGPSLSESIEIVFYEHKEGREKKIAAMNKGERFPEFIAVKNVYEFLLEIGRLNSLDFQKNGGRVIGLTGSNGKTTNKEMLAWLLDGIAPTEVLWTKGNLNNHIGVPLTLLRLNNSYKFAIIEMGTNHPGEIEVLATAAMPTHGLITNIGHAHLEFLVDLEGVYNEKTALFREVEKSPEGFILLNQLDPLLKNYNLKSNSFRINNDVFEMNAKGFTLKFKGKVLNIENSALLGSHQKINMAQCLGLALNLFPNNASFLVARANSFEMPAMNRGEVIKLSSGEVFLDAYNANPDSMKASLDSFMAIVHSRGIDIKNCVFMLGDMNELGAEAPKQHRLMGKELKTLGAVRVCFVGSYAEYYKAGFGEAALFSNSSDAKKWFSDNNGPLTFIKGSRSLQLESILDIKNC